MSNDSILSTSNIQHPEDSAESSAATNGTLLDTNTRRAQTFFSVMPHSFVTLEIKDGIPTGDFLNCCRAITPVFDVLGPTVFAPAKSDIEGNIKKLQTTHNSDPSASKYLLDIIESEQNVGGAFATCALLWLKRSLEFIHAFLKEIHSGNEHLVRAAENAYADTLKKHHNWVARGISSVALKAMPRFSKFLQDLAPTPEDWKQPDYRQQLFTDCGHYITALNNVLCVIGEFYKRSALDV
ncbi:pleckstrin homology domain-containing family A member 8-like [Ornithodoros turicata]|uniref:pleckstrin homology domain-containing family A member 8-like n=1 Tax=Ornithodoros turicata TaxID=34597 RepID=UPI003138D58B